MNTKIRVSVALCTHNGGAFIREQVESILAQTLPVNEIIIGDDASTDDTIAIIEGLLKNTSVHYQVRRHNPGLGVRDNFTDAISATTGDVIILCDQDDRWHSTKVEELVTVLERGRSLVHSDAALVDHSGADLHSTLLDTLKATDWERRNLHNGDALAVLLRRNLVTGATAAVDGTFARALMPVPEGWIHDEWLAMAAAVDGALSLYPKVLTDYRQHQNNQIGAKKETLAARLNRMMAPDVDDDLRRLRRAISAARILPERRIGTPKEWDRLAEAEAHQRFRAALPRNRMLRIPAVVAELIRGRYSRYSRGMLTLARDIVQVHGHERRRRIRELLREYDN